MKTVFLVLLFSVALTGCQTTQPVPSVPDDAVRALGAVSVSGWTVRQCGQDILLSRREPVFLWAWRGMHGGEMSEEEIQGRTVGPSNLVIKLTFGPLMDTASYQRLRQTNERIRQKPFDRVRAREFYPLGFDWREYHPWFRVLPSWHAPHASVYGWTSVHPNLIPKGVELYNEYQSVLGAIGKVFTAYEDAER